MAVNSQYDLRNKRNNLSTNQGAHLAEEEEERRASFQVEETGAKVQWGVQPGCSAQPTPPTGKRYRDDVVLWSKSRQDIVLTSF